MNHVHGASAVAMDPTNSTSNGPSTMIASRARAARNTPATYSNHDSAVAKYRDSTRSRRSRVSIEGTEVATNASSTTEFVPSSCA